jgi:cell division GTPase FtsZ
MDTLIIIPNERLKAIGEKGGDVQRPYCQGGRSPFERCKGHIGSYMSNGFINLDFAE